MMHLRGGRGAIDQTIYPQMDEFYADLARVYSEEIHDLGVAGCGFLQPDEVNLAYLCDPSLQDHVCQGGENPQTMPQTYADLINASLPHRPDTMRVCMHFCPGTFPKRW